MAGKGTVVAFALAVGLVLTGCQTVTGRSMGQWWEDKAATAKVKTALASKRLGTLTRIDVDTYAGTVYLTGTVGSEQARREIEEMAQSAAGGRPVVSRLTVAGETAPAASPGAPRQAR
jgi:hyperosmotically inducible protein